MPSILRFVSHWIGLHFFLAFGLPPLPVVDATLTAREVAVDVPLLPAPDFTALICLF